MCYVIAIWVAVCGLWSAVLILLFAFDWILGIVIGITNNNLGVNEDHVYFSLK